MTENPLSWKMINLEKSYVSFVEKVLNEASEGDFFKQSLKQHTLMEVTYSIR